MPNVRHNDSGNQGNFVPGAPVTADKARKLLTAILPYREISIGGSEPLTREQLTLMLIETLSGYGLIEKEDSPSYSDAEELCNEYK